MRIVIIDGQGGKLGAQLIKATLAELADIELTAIGTNSIATAAMLKSCGSVNAVKIATGENAVKVACRKADIIIGPIGIVIADSLNGEITPDMAVAVGQSSAIRILLPINRCDNIIAGVGTVSAQEMIDDMMYKLRGILGVAKSPSL